MKGDENCFVYGEKTICHKEMISTGEFEVVLPPKKRKDHYGHSKRLGFWDKYSADGI